mmetsp:Transcript_51009/g.110682  ORF Transcript_51009/g.110682 Transcript_51009/m.110682 type:complete len:363 (+) Transcript_51009:78-1166(+)|eukprot:CAMPEP_0170600232 /NCGR_PEP_ID=MMETSP0224-20130122/17226_1 /TAXON_ID=285029 /ORGANISM="Togula jolla, Strain CCCM 725" /LENGTH=362 /DNA_ID=CAMNT_0010924947 /DNA_START=75 /DNA_END=1163 /DNA_ORIENTATION=+
MSLWKAIIALLGAAHMAAPYFFVAAAHGLREKGQASKLTLAGNHASNKQPSVGHFLTNSELAPITSVACLEAKQKNPGIKCINGTSNMLSESSKEYKNTYRKGNYTAGHFPNYKDPLCNSEGEYLCDPDGVLTPEQRAVVAAELKRLREDVVVTCGYLQNDPVESLHYQPFYLGVVIMKEWPLAQSDPQSLQNLGRIISSQWNMNELYVGSAAPYLRCPNSGVLLILPDRRQAFLSSESCEFICQDRGGPEVVTTVRTAMDISVSNSVLAGVQETYRVLQHVPEKSSVQQVSKQSATIDKLQAASKTSGNVVRPLVTRVTADSYNFVLRALFVLAIGLVFASMSLAALVFVLAPGAITRLKK